MVVLGRLLEAAAVQRLLVLTLRSRMATGAVRTLPSSSRHRAPGAIGLGRVLGVGYFKAPR